MATEREPNHIFCVNCGTSNLIEEKDAHGIKACKKCKKAPVSMLALLTDLHMTAEDYGKCPKCGHGNIGMNTHCFFCGVKWREG